MATITNARDVLLQAAGTRLESVGLPVNVSVDFGNVTGTTKPADNADVTQAAINGTVTVTGGGITLSGGGSIMGGQSGYDSGTGFFLGYSSGAYRFSVGNSSGNKITWSGSSLSIVGDIVGSSNIDITGYGRFRGAYTGGDGTAAVYANESGAALSALIGTSGANDYTIKAFNSYTGASSGGGVLGYVNKGAAVDGYTYHAAGLGGLFTNAAGGTALACVGKFELNNSPFQWGSYTWSAPGGSSQLALLANGTWGNPHAAFAATAGETRNDSTGASLWCGANQAVLQTDGNFVVYNGGVPVGSSSGGFPSDRRLKDKIAPTAQDALALMLQLQVVDHTWRVGTPQHQRRGSEPDTGLIAQDVQQILPGLVTAHRSGPGGADETLLLNKTELIPYLVRAVQQLHAEIKAIKLKA